MVYLIFNVSKIKSSFDHARQLVLFSNQKRSSQ